MLRSQGCLQEDEDQMAAKGKMHLIPLRISWNAAVQCSVIICLLAAIQSPLIGCAGASQEDLLDRIAASPDPTSPIVNSSLGMRIDETVTEGKVSIGTFQADLSSQDGTDLESSRKTSNPWRDPALMMEEEYIGTFHISRNMTIKSNYIIQGENYSWLGYDSVYLRFIPSKPVSFSADEIFKCLKCS